MEADLLLKKPRTSVTPTRSGYSVEGVRICSGMTNVEAISVHMKAMLQLTSSDVNDLELLLVAVLVTVRGKTFDVHHANITAYSVARRGYSRTLGHVQSYGTSFPISQV